MKETDFDSDMAEELEKIFRDYPITAAYSFRDEIIEQALRYNGLNKLADAFCKSPKPY